jgi:hypothetical protein
MVLAMVWIGVPNDADDVVDDEDDDRDDVEDVEDGEEHEDWQDGDVPFCRQGDILKVGLLLAVIDSGLCSFSSWRWLASL